MKTVTMTPISSPRSSNTMDSNSFYFPGCRKDANCKCAICIESINATLDLVPTTQTRTRTSSASSRRTVPRTPVSFNSSASEVTETPVIATPPQNSSTRSSISSQEHNKSKRVNKDCRYGVAVVKTFLVLLLVFGAEYGFPFLVSLVLNPRLSPADANNLVLKSQRCKDLNEKIGFLKKELEWVFGDKVTSCNSVDPVWRISKDGLLLHSRCVLYKSITEEVSIWGWPHQTAGLLTTEYSLLSLSIISGRVTEWSNGETKYVVRMANSSWQLGKWSSSAVQFDPNTWILEYKQSSLIENRRLISAVVELLKLRLTREFEKMKHEFWQLSTFGSQLSYFQERRSIPVPT